MIEVRVLTPEPPPSELDAVVSLHRALDAEVHPGRPSLPARRVLLDLTATADLGRNQGLVAWDGDTAVGVVQTWQWYGARNRELGETVFGVHPHHRRRGAGTMLARATAAHLAADGRTKMMAFGLHHDANVAFWRSLGADVDYTERSSRLDVAAVDGDLMGRWIERHHERAGDLRLVRWQGPVPDEHLASYRIAREAMDDAPLHGLEWEKGLDAPEEVAGMTDWWLAMERTPWVIAAVAPEGEIAGYTRVDVDELSPERSWQDDTGVLDAHRGRGIGRWVKAEMWRWLRAEAPQVTHLETENATDNEAMLAINVEMGFEPLRVWAGWQPSIAELTAPR